MGKTTKWSVSLLFFLTFNTLNFQFKAYSDEPSSDTPTVALFAPKPPQLPDPVIINMKAGTVADVTGGMIGTYDWVPSDAASPYVIRLQGQSESVEDLDRYQPYGYSAKDFDFNPGRFKTFAGASLIPFEIQSGIDFIDGKGIFSGIPNDRKAIVSVRFGISGGYPVELLAHAKKAKIHSSVVITDLGPKVDFSQVKFPDEKGRDGRKRPAETTAIRKREYLNPKTPEGSAAIEILDAGYEFIAPAKGKKGVREIAPGSFVLTGPALYNPEVIEIAPLMHHKEMFLIVLKDATKPLTVENIETVYAQDGTGNWTNPHLNWSYFSKFLPIGKYSVDHALRMYEAFTVSEQGKATIADIDSPAPQRVVFPDGGYIETAYTDSQYEYNHRIIRFLQSAVETDPKLLKIDEVVLSHFVLTHNAGFKALFDAWKIHRFKIRGLIDGKFVGVRNFGFAAALEDYFVDRPFGNPLPGGGQEFANDVELTVFLKEIEGAKDIDPEGRPSHRNLQHGKTTAIKYQTRATAKGAWNQRVRIWRGSYNFSTHFANAERQDEIDTVPTDPFATVFLDSVRGVEKRAIEEGYGLPMEEAILVIVLGEFLGHSPMDIDFKSNRRLIEIFSADRIDPPALKEAHGLIMKMTEKASRLIEKYRVPIEEVKQRLESLENFVTWYNETFLKSTDTEIKKFRMSVQTIVGAAIAITDNPFEARQALENALAKAGLSEKQVEYYLRKAWQSLGLEKKFEIPPSLAYYQRLKLERDRFKLIYGCLNDRDAECATENTYAAAKASWFYKNKVIDKKDLLHRFENFMRFLEWYDKLPSYNIDDRRIRLSHILYLIVKDGLPLFVLPGAEAIHLKEGLIFLLELKGLYPDKIAKLLPEAWQILEIKDPIPGDEIPTRAFAPAPRGAPESRDLEAADPSENGDTRSPRLHPPKPPTRLEERRATRDSRLSRLARMSLNQLREQPRRNPLCHMYLD